MSDVDAGTPGAEQERHQVRHCLEPHLTPVFQGFLGQIRLLLKRESSFKVQVLRGMGMEESCGESGSPHAMHKCFPLIRLRCVVLGRNGEHSVIGGKSTPISEPRFIFP